MCSRLVHRGPDAEGVFLADSVALGIRRLSIIDVHTGAQPVFDETRAISVVTNGEIYNFQELRRDLKRQGHTFSTDTDVEVLPHLYEEYGVDMLSRLNGMFALALWDARRKRLFIARDRFGEKPLYYGVFDRKLIFASEVKAILEHPAVETSIDFHAMRQYLAFDYVPAPLSIYRGIYKLPAAHSLILENGKISIQPYWDLSFKKQQPVPSIDAAAQELRELLADATKIRLTSDRPLGVLLSGGVDSSTVAAFAQRFSTRPVKTFSIGFEEGTFDELRYARRVAKHIGAEHHDDILTIRSAGDLIQDVASWLDEPLGDASILPTFMLSAFVRSEVTVALGGDGGDEIFGGYPWYYAHKLAERYEKIPRFVRQSVIEPILTGLPVRRSNMSFDLLAKRFVNSLSSSDLAERHHSFFGSFLPVEQESLLTRYVKSHNGADVYEGSRKWIKIWDHANANGNGSGKDSDYVIERMQFLDIKSFLAENILTKVDRASMAVSLEVRSPFLDHRIAEFSASLPRDYKLNCRTAKFALGRTGKFILKKAVEPILPRQVVGRKKQGFTVPVSAWLRDGLNPLIREFLAYDRIKRQGMFDPHYVENLLVEHEMYRRDNSKTLWNLLVFQLWLENFLPRSFL
jgi:asparagine synthase (glutamine-hydrolysing)